MAQRKLPLKPDVVLNDYWKDNEKFADLLNAVFFDGKEVVHKAWILGISMTRASNTS